MTTIREYCTLEDFRAAKTPKETSLVVGTGDGTLVRDFIREVSTLIDDAAGRSFAPLIATRYFDAARDVDGFLLRVSPFDLLAVSSITNGDATSVASDKYVFEPAHNPPYWGVRFLTSKGLTWTYSDDPENAITVVGTWNYHDDYANAWESVDTLAAAITTTSATSATLTTGAGNPGELWKIDSEFLYLSARTTTAATLVRGVNGSTAATHLISAPISRWVPMRTVAGLCRAATIIKYAIRENPQIESIQVDGHVLTVPKDIGGFIETEVRRLGLVKI